MKLPFTDNLALHLDASSITGASDGDRIQQWNDLSGNGYNLSQATLSARPTYRAEDMLGKPTLHFDGNALRASSSSVLNINPPMSVVVVHAPMVPRNASAGVPLGGLVGKAYLASVTGWGMYSRSGSSGMVGGSFQVRQAGVGNFGVNGKNFPAGTPIVQSCVVDPITSGDDFMVNRQNSDDLTNRFFSLSSTTSSNLLSVGDNSSGSWPYRGDVSEILIFQSTLTEDKVQELEQHLGEKWLNWKPRFQSYKVRVGGSFFSRRSKKKVGGAFVRYSPYVITTGIDPRVQDFAATSGATDLVGMSNLIKYIRRQGFLGKFVLWPAKSEQSAGSGSVLHSLGWTSPKNFTLVGSPTWQEDGLVFSGSGQYGILTNFFGNNHLTTWIRGEDWSTDTSANRYIFSQWNVSGEARSWATVKRSGGELGTQRSNNGTFDAGAGSVRLGSAIGSDPKVIVSEFAAGSVERVWRGTTEEGMTTSFGTSQVSRLNSDASVNLMTGGDGALGDMGGKIQACAILYGVLPTDEQRESITHLIESL